MSDAGELVEALFDTDLPKRPLRFEDFEPGSDQEPDPEEGAPPGLKLTSALLLDAGQLRVSYEARLGPRPDSLRVAVRTPGEMLPRAQEAVPNRESGTATVAFDPAAFRDAHGTILASLVAKLPDGKRESAPVWVIFAQVGLAEPSWQDVVEALEQYRMFTDGDLLAFRTELSGK